MAAVDASSEKFDSVVMEEEFDKQQPGLPGTMTLAELEHAHGKLLARASRWEGKDAPSAAQLRIMEQIIDARLQVQYAQRMEEIEENAQARIGLILAARSAAPHSFHQAMVHAALVDQEGRTRLTRAMACIAALLTVLLSVSATLGLTRATTHRACVTNEQCRGGSGLSYCSPIDGICQFCATAVSPRETGAPDAVGFCAGGASVHPACEACVDGAGFGQWNLVAFPRNIGSDLSMGTAENRGPSSGATRVFNSTWGTVTESRVVSARLEVMRYSDIQALVLSAAVVAGSLGVHMRDVKLCELKLRRNERQLQGKDGRVSGKWRGPMWLCCVLRQYALLPTVASSLPLLLVSGGAGSPHSSADATAMCVHAVTLCFALLALNYVALESALPMGSRIAAEEDFARSRGTTAINSHTGGSQVQASASHSRRLLAVSPQEGDRLATNDIVAVSTVGVQFAAMLIPVLVGRAEAARSRSSDQAAARAGENGYVDASMAVVLSVAAPFLGSLFVGVLEGAALADRKLSTSSRLCGVLIEVGKWLAGLLILILLDAVLIS